MQPELKANRGNDEVFYFPLLVDILRGANLVEIHFIELQISLC